MTSVKVYAETPPAAGSDAFPTNHTITLYIPRGSKATYETADIWKDFSSIVEFDDIIKGDANGDGEVNVADVVEIVNYIMDKSSDKFVFAAADMSDDGVVTICSMAFATCRHFVMLYIPRSVHLIGDFVFGPGGGKIVI